MKINVKSVYQYHCSGDTLLLQVAAEVILKSKGVVNLGLKPTDAARCSNIEIKVKGTEKDKLLQTWKLFHRYWLEQQSGLMIREVESESVSTTFNLQNHDFKKAQDAYGQFLSHHSTKYSAAPLSSHPIDERIQTRIYISNVFACWHRGEGSVKAYCPFCAQAIYIKHAGFKVASDNMPAWYTVKDDRKHEYCDFRFIYNTEDIQGSDNEEDEEEEDVILADEGIVDMMEMEVDGDEAEAAASLL